MQSLKYRFGEDINKRWTRKRDYILVKIWTSLETQDVL